VDDIFLFGATGENKEQTMKVLNTEFNVNDMGELNWLLVIQITLTEGGITLCRTILINKIVNNFSIHHCKPATGKMTLRDA
jgi:hypothetical protein